MPSSELSNSPNRIKSLLANKHFQRTTIIIVRSLVGFVFIISGWAKAVDPAGFMIKVGEYLHVWDWQMPHEAIVMGCIGLSAIEFGIGILILVGSLKRVAVWVATALMAFMLPLTLYIAISDPVADCGCFGDLFVISNWATFFKNIGISCLLFILLKYNSKIKGLFPNPIQWLVATTAIAFPIFLSFIGYQVQPVSDFRPFVNGEQIFHAGTDTDEDALYIYERNGERREFTLDEIPDDSWTFVEADIPENEGADIAVRDEDGEDVSDDIVQTADSIPQVWMIVPDPGLLFLTYSRQINLLQRYLKEQNIDFTAIVGSRAAGYDYWVDLVRPTYPVYSAENTSLAQLVRGNVSLVYTRGGRIVWKRTVASLPNDIIDRNTEDITLPQANVLDTVSPIDDGRFAGISVIVFISILFGLYLLGHSPKLLRLITARRH